MNKYSGSTQNDSKITEKTLWVMNKYSEKRI